MSCISVVCAPGLWWATQRAGLSQVAAHKLPSQTPRSVPYLPSTAHLVLCPKARPADLDSQSSEVACWPCSMGLLTKKPVLSQLGSCPVSQAGQNQFLCSDGKSSLRFRSGDMSLSRNKRPGGLQRGPGRLICPHKVLPSLAAPPVSCSSRAP